METNNLTLNDITFPIRSASVFAKLNEDWLRIPGKNALINNKSKFPISVVSDGYEIITNEEAYNYGKLCLQTLFALRTDRSIKVFNIISPKTLSFCHIDLIAEKKDLPILTKDRYIPFVRVTNSYNAMFKLSFRVGICRNICLNGMIFGADSIRYSFIHSKGLRRNINFDIKKDEFEHILMNFKEDIQVLLDNPIPDDYSFGIFCKAIGLKYNSNNDSDRVKKRNSKKFEQIEDYFYKRLTKYVNEVGNNFYALYNVITELATYGFEDEHKSALWTNGRQIKAGVWLNSVAEMLRKGNIDYREYLEEYLMIAEN
jgi:hypothetical protein